MYSLGRHKEEIKTILRMAYPISLGQFGIMLMNIVDSVMVGNLSAADLAASSVAHSLFILVLIFGLGISYAVTPLVAIAIGENDTSHCGGLVKQSLYVNIITGIFLAFFSYYTSGIIYVLGLPEEITGKAVSYLRILGYSMFPVMIGQTFKQFFDGFGIMKPGMYASLSANIINFLTNWLLIFGNLGFPQMGLDGAGYATLFSRIYMALFLILYFYYDNRFRVYRFNFLDFRIEARDFMKIIRLGIPVGLQHFFEVGAFSLASIMVAWIGVKELAAHQIAMNIASITFMLILGISSAAAVRIGNAYGERVLNKIRNIGNLGMGISLGLEVFFGLLLVIFKGILPWFYVKDGGVVEIASGLLIIAALFQIFDGLQATGIGILRGLTDMKVPMVMSFGSYWLVGIASGYVLAFIFSLGVYGIWIGFLLSLITSSSLFYFRFRLKLRHFKETFPR